MARNNRNKPPKNPNKFRCRICGWEGPGPLPTCAVHEDEHCPGCGEGGGVIGPVWKGMNTWTGPAFPEERIYGT